VSGSKKFMTETNAVSEFKGFEKLQGLVALSDSTGTPLISLHSPPNLKPKHTLTESRTTDRDGRRVRGDSGLPQFPGDLGQRDSPVQPGTHAHIHDAHRHTHERTAWLKATRLDHDTVLAQTTFVSVPKDDPMLQHGQKITARKGTRKHHTHN
jgi:hypothetical protein